MGFKFCAEITPERVCYLIIVIMSAFGVYSIVAYGIKQVRQLQLPGKMKILYYANSFLFVWGATGYMLLDTIPFSSYFCTVDHLLIPFGVLGGYCGYLLGLLMLYAMFVERLRITFAGTPLAISNTFYYFLLFGIVVEFIPLFVGLLAYWIRTDSEQMGSMALGMLMGLLFQIANAFYGVLLVFAFFRKTCVVAKQIMNSNSNSGNKQSNEEMMYLYNLVDPAVKYTLCAVSAVITTIGVNYLSIHRGLVVDMDTFDLMFLHVSLNNFDILVNTICLQLQFSYFNSTYEVLCKPCKKGLNYFVFKKIISPNIQQKTLEIVNVNIIKIYRLFDHIN